MPFVIAIRRSQLVLSFEFYGPEKKPCLLIFL